MALSRRSSRSRFTLVLLVLTSITILTLDFRGSGFVDDARSIAATAFSPIRAAARTLLSPFGGLWNGIANYGDVKDENARLREQLAQLEGDQARGVEAQRQLDDLAAANGLSVTSSHPTVTARVVGGPLSNFDQTIELDKGSRSGVKVDMPVVTGAGLVGRVVQVSGGRSVVELITDPSSVIGVRLATSGEWGVARGTGTDGPLTVDSGIDTRVDVATGEPVLTSGMERSIYPPDVPVGTVAHVERSADQRQQNLEVEPLAELNRLTYVKVLLWEPAP